MSDRTTEAVRAFADRAAAEMMTQDMGRVPFIRDNHSFDASWHSTAGRIEICLEMNGVEHSLAIAADSKEAIAAAIVSALAD